MKIQFKYDFDKTKAALLLMASFGDLKLDQYKACKLLFLSDKRHLVKYGRSITGDDYCALEHGPIPSKTRDILKAFENDLNDNPFVVQFKEAFSLNRGFQYPRLEAKQHFDENVLSKSDVNVITEIVKEFGNKGFSELKSITHEMVAYKNAWAPTDEEKSFPMSFVDFFAQDEDAASGAKEEMEENFLLRKAFSGA